MSKCSRATCVHNSFPATEYCSKHAPAIKQINDHDYVSQMYKATELIGMGQNPVLKGVTRVHNYPVAIKLCNGVSAEYTAGKTIGDKSYHFTRVLDYFHYHKECHGVLITEVVGCTLRKWIGKQKSKVSDHIIHQLLESIYHFHSSGYLHLDIKRDNFCVAYGHNKFTRPYIKLIDLGGAESIKDMNASERHVTSCNSANASLRDEHVKHITPADEMESLGYMIWYIKYGSLPWEHTSEDDNSIRIKMKQESRKNAPVEIRRYLTLCDNTPRRGLPDYAALLSVLLSPNSTLTLEPLGQSPNPVTYDLSSRYELCSAYLMSLLQFRDGPFDMSRIPGIAPSSLASLREHNIHTLANIFEKRKEYQLKNRRECHTVDLLSGWGIVDPAILTALSFKNSFL